MVEKRQPIPVKEAIERVMERARPLNSEIVPLDLAYGRILAESIIASHSVPPFDRSPYDGFAVRSIDTNGASGDSRISFKVVDHIGAGTVSMHTIGEREAVRIMTGAPLPDGADAVVMLEQTVIDGDTFTIRKSFSPLENVSLKGEDAKEGEMIVEAGTYIHPGIIAVMATFGYAKVSVSKKPVVGLLATGTELLEVSDPLEPGKIRNSNGPMIAAQLARMGIEYRLLGTLPDDEEACYELVKKAVDECDAVITTGGVSVGDFDFLPAIYKRLGADVLFNKVAMRPGSVTTVAHVNNTFLFGLSGNPSACFTGFELFARPAFLLMMGCDKPYLPYEKAILTEDFTKANPFSRFIRAVYESTPNGAFVKPAGFNKSNAVTSIARGNSFIVLPGGTRGFQKGDEVDVLLLGTEEGVEQWMLD
ncbi:molybdopterin molybdotransferase MoeA [Domibacillus epiphyticus]|uniref:Molybdopterin molybdenumtransferase n=1 Tax=Domibacillus epiphyticus TaxID=1714355 RepID=A0A1V2A4G6_9BACI|nr:gephyrin-like molybdotransferase Glp [Domibacillus epiphyticus]OMP65752.1 molybdopterin molybdenumtransferase [Domibacillus epiphyticus]